MCFILYVGYHILLLQFIKNNVKNEDDHKLHHISRRKKYCLSNDSNTLYLHSNFLLRSSKSSIEQLHGEPVIKPADSPVHCRVNKAGWKCWGEKNDPWLGTKPKLDPTKRERLALLLRENKNHLGFPLWSSGLCRGHEFDPWSRRFHTLRRQLRLWAAITEPRPFSLSSITRETTALRSLSITTRE